MNDSEDEQDRKAVEGDSINPVRTTSGGTARKQALEALPLRDKQFRVAFEEAPVGMVIGSGDRIITAVNHAMCRMIGYPRHELIGQRVTDFIHDEDREKYAPVTQRLFTGEIPGFTNEKRYRRKKWHDVLGPDYDQRVA